MAKVTLKKDTNTAVQEISHKLDDLDKLIDIYGKKKEILTEFENWRNDVKRTLDGNFL